MANGERDDPTAAARAAKRSASMLRDARSVLRRLDVLLATASAADDPKVAVIDKARAAAERVVVHLTRQGAAQQREARDAVRRRIVPRQHGHEGRAVRG